MLSLAFKKSDGTQYNYSNDLYDVRWANIIKGGHATLQAMLPVDYTTQKITEGMDVSLYDDLDEIWLGRVEDIPRTTAQKKAVVINCLGYTSTLLEGYFQRIYRDEKLENWERKKYIWTEKDISGKFTTDKFNRLHIQDQNNTSYYTAEAEQFVYSIFPEQGEITKITFNFDYDCNTTYFKPALYKGSTLIWQGTTTGYQTGSQSITMAGIYGLTFRLICVGSTTGTGNNYVSFTNIKVYGSSLTTNIYTYEVIKDILALNPDISTDYSLIPATSKDINHLKFLDRVTWKEGFISVDKYHFYNYGFWDRDSTSNEKPRFTYKPHDRSKVDYYVSLKNSNLELAGKSMQDKIDRVWFGYKDADSKQRYGTVFLSSNLYKSHLVNVDTTSESEAGYYGNAYFDEKKRPQTKGQIIIKGTLVDDQGREIGVHRIQAGKNIFIYDLEPSPDVLDSLNSSDVLNGVNIFKITQVDVNYKNNQATLQLDVASDRLDLLLAQK